MSEGVSWTPCICEEVDGVLTPDPDCELHWHQVIDAGDVPPVLFP